MRDRALWGAVLAAIVVGLLSFCFSLAEPSQRGPRYIELKDAHVRAYLAAQEHDGHNPIACGREDDREREEGRAACECYHEHDPCDPDRPETRACGAFCDKSKCGCCQI